MQNAEIVAMYVESGVSEKDAKVLAEGYMDAIDGVVEGMYFMLKIIGQVGGTYRTKKGHSVKGSLEAL